MTVNLRLGFGAHLLVRFYCVWLVERISATKFIYFPAEAKGCGASQEQTGQQTRHGMLVITRSSRHVTYICTRNGGCATIRILPYMYSARRPDQYDSHTTEKFYLLESSSYQVKI